MAREETVNSTVEFDPNLSALLIWNYATDAEKIFLDSQLLVLDGTSWDADLDVIRSGLVDKRRAFKAPYLEREPKPEVRKHVRRLIDHAKWLFPQIYPHFRSVEERTSFRPMVTGPEPLHFDSYGGEAPLVTAYINVSDVPRVYKIGPNFPMLVETHPDELRALRDVAIKRGEPLDVSYALRQMDGGPLGPQAPRHHVELAPGAIWFFNAKTVSHEVVYGRGAVGISWEVPACGAKMQADYLKEL
jgi:hypothetical protein